MVVRPSPDGGARATAWGWAVLVVLFAAQAWVLYREMPPGGEGLFPGADKVAHVLLFAAPALLAARQRLPGGVLLVGLHALASEPLQGALTLTRTPDVWDTACDLAGICLGLLWRACWLAAWGPGE